MLQRIRDGFGRSVIVVLLGLIAVSFIFWGIDFNFTGPNYAAKVNGEEIPLTEFERNLQAEQSNFLELYRVELDEQIRRQLRASVIERLINQRALSQRVEELGYRVSDERLAESVQSIPMFQIGGEFSFDMLKNQLAYQGISVAAFEEMQRQQLELLDLQNGIVNASFVTPDEYARYVELLNQRREIAYAAFEVASFLDGVEITDEQVAEHYQEFGERYMTEETAAIEYIELRRADLAEQIEVDEAALRDYYEQRRDEFRTEEERAASHILITPEEGETDEQTRARAEALVERIRGGEDFAALAKEYSDDPGTASAGGSLGWITRGMLDAAFTDALYAMAEVGDVSDPVKTDFGWHIIRFDDIRPGEERSFEEVRDQLADEYRNERADDLFYDQANRLADVAFEEYDNLERVASMLGLPLKRLDAFPRSGDPEAFPNSAPVVDAVFGLDAVEVGVNSDLIELAEDHVVVVRVVERFPPEQRPLEEVADGIRETLRRERAEELAAEAADAFAAALPDELTAEFLGGGTDATDASGGDEAGADAEGDASADGEESASASADAEASGDEASSQPADGAGADGADADVPAARLAAEHGGTWHAPRWVQRSDTEVPSEVLAAAFDLGTPPEGARLRDTVEMANGDRVLLVLSGVEPGNPSDVPLDRRTAIQQQLLEASAGGEIGAYASSVRQRAKVDVPPQVLETQF
ncbi:MAG TPA: SurA N-terminal domain-containing protein [Gammaproteobacteria bacterium]